MARGLPVALFAALAGTSSSVCINVYAMHAASVVFSTEKVMPSDVRSFGAPSALLRMTSGWG